MPLVHQHLIVRALVEKPIIDKEEACEWMRQLVHKIGMSIVTGPHCGYVEIPGNRGLTVCVLIETSHCTMHIWDEDQPSLVQLDVYTCSNLELEKVFEHLESMNPIKIDYKFLDREHGLNIVK